MSGSKLIDLIRRQAAGLTPRGIELATVLTLPALRIRIDNMDINLEGSDLIICAHLVTYNGQTFDQVGDNISTQHTTVAFQDQILQAGDRVAVMALPGEQQYLVWDKVVIMGE
jgi:hypothetical protein